MSVVHDGRVAGRVGPPVRDGKLLQRLMILCPETGRAADTGFALTALPRLPARPQVLVDCLECGQDHRWQVEDSFLE